MLFALGPALGALSAVGSLLESAVSSIGQEVGNDLSALGQTFTAGNQPSSNPATGGTTTGPFASGTLATLISLQGQSGPGSSLFATIDADSNGSISKSEFEGALSGVGVDSNSADNVFAQLDADGDGSISQSELSSRAGYHHRQGAHGASWLLNAIGAEGATTQTTTNADNSTTTTISYTDGSTVSTTTPASGGSGTPNVNLLEQLIKLQAQLVSPATGTTTTVA
jgi:hypothetical protein